MQIKGKLFSSLGKLFYICSMRGSKLEKVLQKRGISQALIASNMTTITRPTLYKWENQPNKYTLEQFEEMACIMKMDVALLLLDLELIS